MTVGLLVILTAENWVESKVDRKDPSMAEWKVETMAENWAASKDKKMAVY